MTPLYGFLQGDTIGLLVLAGEDDTAATLAEKLISAASVRAPAPDRPRVVFRGETLAADVTVTRAGMRPLDWFDVVRGGG